MQVIVTHKCCSYLRKDALSKRVTNLDSFRDVFIVVDFNIISLYERVVNLLGRSLAKFKQTLLLLFFVLSDLFCLLFRDVGRPCCGRLVGVTDIEVFLEVPPSLCYVQLLACVMGSF